MWSRPTYRDSSPIAGTDAGARRGQGHGTDGESGRWDGGAEARGIDYRGACDRVRDERGRVAARASGRDARRRTGGRPRAGGLSQARPRDEEGPHTRERRWLAPPGGDERARESGAPWEGRRALSGPASGPG